MARYIGPVCKLCRAEGSKLFLKGERCYTDKCSFEKRSYGPGQFKHGSRKAKLSEYGLQLREKQKLKRTYGLLEKQFRLTYQKAVKQKGKTGANLLILLERRLDNMLYRMGFANSRAEARQLIKHSHVILNGKKHNIPSSLLKKDDLILIKKESRDINTIKNAMEASKRKGIVSWLDVNYEDFSSRVMALPTREDLSIEIQEQLIVEFYSR